MPRSGARGEKVRRRVNPTGLPRSLYKMAEFSSIHYSRMIFRLNAPAKIAENGHADLHAVDRSFGHPASDPAGADGRDRGRAAHIGGQRRRRGRQSLRGVWGQNGGWAGKTPTPRTILGPPPWPSQPEPCPTR